jgi:hypothetical protein
LQQNNKRIDLALVSGKRGVLALSKDGLTFTPRRGTPFLIKISEIGSLSYRKTALTTSTLYINDLEITVCRAHLWAADIEGLRAK